MRYEVRGEMVAAIATPVRLRERAAWRSATIQPAPLQSLDHADSMARLFSAQSSDDWRLVATSYQLSPWASHRSCGRDSRSGRLASIAYGLSTRMIARQARNDRTPGVIRQPYTKAWKFSLRPQSLFMGPRSLICRDRGLCPGIAGLFIPKSLYRSPQRRGLGHKTGSLRCDEPHGVPNSSPCVSGRRGQFR
jgi:hypothetical protein